MALVTSWDEDAQDYVTYDDGVDTTDTTSSDTTDYSSTDYIPDSTVTSSSGDPLDYLYGVPVTYSDGSKQTLNEDGSTTYQDPDGQTYAVTPDGKYITQSEGKTWTYDPKQNGFIDAAGKLIKDAASSAPSGLWNKVLGVVAKNPLAAFGTAAAGIKALQGGNKVKPVGWQGKIPMDTRMVRSQIQYNDPNRRPGESGRQYFSDTNYAAPADVAAAKANVINQTQGILSAYKPAAAEVSPYTEKNPAIAMPWAKRQEATTATPSTPASGVASLNPVPTAENILGMAKGGQAPRYLQGPTDGMADKIPSSIDGKQKAALSHGEFVVPADVVSHLGNGNSDAGAQKLYQMMAKVRQARTGNPEQGKRIDPNKFMPGGAVGYASGGAIKGFDGTTGSTVSAGTTGASTGGSTLGTSTQGNLAEWAGPYVADYLGKGAAVANAPYQAYTGPLTAGASDLQQQQFAGLQSLAQTGYDPTKFTGGTFDATAAQNYMNPYLKTALAPQLDELRRQGQITNLANQAQATKQGAFGSSGSALMQTEGQRNVLDKMNAALGQGYSTAYDKAQAAYSSDAQRAMDAQKAQEQSQQYSADYGLKTLDKLGAAGETQRGIEQQGITADLNQFNEQRDYPAKMVQFQKDLMQGLPITASQTTNNQTDISNISSQLQGLLSLYSTLSKLGQTP